VSPGGPICLNSLLLLKGGRLAYEYHAYPYQPDTQRDSFSTVDFTSEYGKRNRLTGSLTGSYPMQQIGPDNIFGFGGYRQKGTPVASRGRWVSDGVFEFELRPLNYGISRPEGPGLAATQ